MLYKKVSYQVVKLPYKKTSIDEVSFYPALTSSKLPTSRYREKRER
jgi:hypothetical protein